MDDELIALAVAGATSLVQVMASDSWDTSKNRIAAFLTRGHGPAAADESDALQAECGEVAQARTRGDEATITHVETRWRRRFVHILCSDPGAVGELRELLAVLEPGRQGRRGHREQDAQRGQVPAPPVHFIDRENYLRTLDDCLGRGGPRAATGVLTGPPGVGKTAMALQWAHHSRHRFPDGRLYVDFAASTDPPDADLSAAVSRCLRDLGVNETSLPCTLAEKVAMFRALTAHQRLLLVLDHVTSPAQVRTLTPTGTGSAVLATSRTSLSELVLDGAQLMYLEPLDLQAGLALLAEHCGLSAVDADRQAAKSLVDLCGGLPGVLRLAANGYRGDRDTSLVDLVARLERLPGEGTVASAVFDCAYRELTPDAARLCRLLSWMPGHTFDAATAAAAADLSVADAARLLDALEDAYLLDRVTGGRHRMHDLVRQHAWTRAVAEERATEEVALAERVVKHYLTLTARADHALHPHRLRIADRAPLLSPIHDQHADRGSQLEWLDAEHSNILAALRTAFRFELHGVTWQLAEALCGVFAYRGHRDDWQEVLELGAQAAWATPAPAAEARLRSLLSRILTDKGELDQARAELQTAITLAEAIGNPALSAAVQECLGLHEERTDPVRAVEAYERCLDLNRQAGNHWGTAVARYRLGRAQDASGAHERALSTLRRAHAELTDIGAPNMAARALTAIGTAHDHRAETATALLALRHAAHALREQGETAEETRTLLQIADIVERDGIQAEHDVEQLLIRVAEIQEAEGNIDLSGFPRSSRGVGAGCGPGVLDGADFVAGRPS